MATVKFFGNLVKGFQNLASNVSLKGLATAKPALDNNAILKGSAEFNKLRNANMRGDANQKTQVQLLQEQVQHLRTIAERVGGQTLDVFQKTGEAVFKVTGV